MAASVTLLGGILDVAKTIADALVNPKGTYDKAVDWTSRQFDNLASAGKLVKDLFVPNAMRGGMSTALRFLAGHGVSQSEADAMVANFAAESGMNPLARNGSHLGIAQWDLARQRVFSRRYGYAMGSSSVSAKQQLDDQLAFSLYELQTSQRSAALAMARASDLKGKTKAFMDLFERPGDGSFGRRLNFAMDADRLATLLGYASSSFSSARAASHITSETHIGDVHLHTSATDPKSHAAAFRDGISDLPLMNSADMSMLLSGTRATQ